MRARILLGLAAALLAVPLRAEPRFENYEIRVIRPRYFVKTGKLELATGLGTIVNQTFVYSFLATGLMTYHFSETLAVEAQGAYGTNVDRDDKRILKDDFGIRAILLLPQSLANGRFVWTPSYGKFNLTASHMVYFDTDLTVGAGVTGIHYNYDYCDTPPPQQTKQYPTILAGLSQRYFLDHSSSLRLGIEDQKVMVATADASCTPDVATGSTVMHDDLLLYIAWSYYL